MEEAETNSAWSMKRPAMRYRDGLLIAFLAFGTEYLIAGRRWNRSRRRG
jgi:hypothetical protein